MARHKKFIDKRTFENLCAIQSTLNEICVVFDCDNKTLETWCKREYKKNFSEIFKEKRCKGFISLRRAQFQKAIDEKNTTMQIFLGKNWLGQSDKVELAGNNDNPVKIETINLKKLSDEELQTLKIIAEKVNV